MERMRYSAVDASGRLVHGEIDAASEADGVAALRRQGLLPVRLEAARAGGSGLRGVLDVQFGARSGLGRQEVADLIGELAVMLGAGQPIDGALRFIVETAPGRRVRTVASALHEAGRSGGSLADAMARQDGSCRAIDVAMVRAGEASGQLAPALDHLARLLERQRSLVASVRTAMIYPALLLVAATGAIGLMLTQVLPQFVPLFEQNGAKLPPSTRFMIDAGDFLSAHGLTLMLSVLAAVLSAMAVLRVPAVRLGAERALLGLPVIGGLQREVLAARFTRTLGTLVSNGVPLTAALAIVREAIGHRVARLAVERADLSVRGGGGLSAPLAESGVFPVRMTQLLRLGEANAQLGPMALRAAGIHEARTAQAVQRLLALLVPTITVVMGLAVAGIVASLLTAMLSLNDLAV